jgi:hypothetical protein
LLPLYLKSLGTQNKITDQKALDAGIKEKLVLNLSCTLNSIQTAGEVITASNQA